MTHQGWTNYETRNVALWISNEKGSYNYWRGRTQQCWENAEASEALTREEATRFALAAILRTELEEENPLTDPCTMYSDILLIAIGSVNCEEIATRWIDAEEFEKEEAEEGKP